MLNKDANLKKSRGYTDPKSFVRLDGSEVLHNEDWVKRKLELHERSGGFCERVKILGEPHVRMCSMHGEEPHHIKPRWPKRDDRLENLANLSHACHWAEDERKIGGRSKKGATA